MKNFSASLSRKGECITLVHYLYWLTILVSVNFPSLSYYSTLKAESTQDLQIFQSSPKHFFKGRHFVNLYFLENAIHSNAMNIFDVTLRINPECQRVEE